MLNYETRVQYINGYLSGEFKPSGNITRAEASTLFYNLLKETTIEKEISFSDLNPNEWYYNSMITLSSKNMISGYPDGTIKATKAITRAEFITLVSRFTELTSGQRSFTDLSSSHWAYKYIVSAAEKGWLVGYPDGSFKANDNITRAEAVKIINSMLGRIPNKEELDNTTGLKYFTDVSRSHWAYYQIIEAANSFLSE
ncbi:MAG: S-layer homology domain-containing protein [Acidaminobacteraceae bacterium]